MDHDRLREALRATRTLGDLRHLVQALELTPLWSDVPADTGSRPSRRRVPALVAIARAGDFPWFAAAAPDAVPRALAIARLLAARGRIAGVWVLAPSARTLAVGVAFGEFPVLAIHLDSPAPAAIASLVRLGGGHASGTLAYAAHVATALSTERVGHRFFGAFHSTLTRMAASLPAPMHREDRHDFALLQLTRVLFLYFVQTKGWLDGREQFLGEEVDRCLARGRRLHRDLLRPLFFGTLNRPIHGRTRTAAAFGAIPFLNGGLFEPHSLERRYRIDIPNAVWRDAFDGLFESFHFTVAERDRRGAIAPDMLGRVFEGVMEPDHRRATGTFYTPAALVDRVIDAGFAALVAERLRCSDREADRRLRDAEPGAVAALESVTILDPAVGSGAFLLGALERLSGFGKPSIERKRRILQRNLFGVDRNAAAVRLTELRLWLAVIADDPAERAGDVAPLPNLDCLVRQGDSLFDPVRASYGVAPPGDDRAAELPALRARVIMASGPIKAELTRQLRSTELQILTTSLYHAERLLREEIAGCLHDARGHDLFENRRGLDRELQDRLRRLREDLHETRRARRQAGAGEVPWFHYRSHFADVFAGGGFDVVIGNPPWQRAETIPPATRRRLAGRYRWWQARCGGYGNPPDLAVAFLERALELAAPRGVVALLVPAKMTSASYGHAARHALASETTLHVVADLTGDRPAGFDATVYPLAIVAVKRGAASAHRLRTSLDVTDPDGLNIRQSTLRGGGPWLLVSDRHRRALEMLRADHPRLDERFPCHLGVKTGANPLFLEPPADLEPDVIRWAVRGRDVTAFRVRPTVRLLWTHGPDGQPYRTLPPHAAAHLAPHHAALRARADFVRGAPWTLFRVAAASACHRVIWADLARHLAAVPLTGARDRAYIPLNTCYVVAATSAMEAERLAAWLNSTWIRIAARAAAPPASGGFARFNAAVIGALPLPAAALQDPELTELADAARAGHEVQASLDARVASHLGLSTRVQTALRSLPHAPSHDRR